MSQEIVVGVDLGTTDTKVALTTPDGVPVASARRPTSWQSDAQGRLTTTGAALVAGVLATVRDALRLAREDGPQRLSVLGMGVAGLAESGVVLDARGAEASPVIAWFDDRGAAEVLALDPQFRAEFPRRTGLAIGPQWTLAKLLWLRGAGLALTPGTRWLNVPEFVAWSLTGAQVSEPSLASRTGLIDQNTGSAWDEALAILGVDPAFLPDTLTAGQPAGRIRGCSAVPELNGAVVTVAGHDHPVAAVGAGATGTEDLFDSCGTAEVLLRVAPRVLSDDEREQLVAAGIDAGRHVLPGQTVLLAGLRTGLVLRRVLSLVGAAEPAARDGLDRRWDAAPGRVDGVSVTGSAMNGSAMNSNDVLLRVGDGASPDAVWAAALEHVSSVTGELLDSMTTVVGPHRCAVAAGGWTNMRSVRESKRRVIPRLSFCPESQPGTRGAALFAACAAAGGAGFDERAALFASTAPVTARPAADQQDGTAGPATAGAGSVSVITDRRKRAMS